MARFEGGSHALDRPRRHPVRGIRRPPRRARALDRHIEQFFANLPEGFERGSVRYVNISGFDTEDPWSVILPHFFNHQTHHRAQVHTLLSQLGTSHRCSTCTACCGRSDLKRNLVVPSAAEGALFPRTVNRIGKGPSTTLHLAQGDGAFFSKISFRHAAASATPSLPRARAAATFDRRARWRRRWRRRSGSAAAATAIRHPRCRAVSATLEPRPPLLLERQSDPVGGVRGSFSSATAFTKGQPRNTPSRWCAPAGRRRPGSAPSAACRRAGRAAADATGRRRSGRPSTGSGV